MKKRKEGTYNKKAQRIVELKNKIEKFKKVYDELDSLIVELAMISPDSPIWKAESYNVMIVDNFAKGNLAWKSTAIKRFEAAILNRVGE